MTIPVKEDEGLLFKFKGDGADIYNKDRPCDLSSYGKPTVARLIPDYPKGKTTGVSGIFGDGKGLQKLDTSFRNTQTYGRGLIEQRKVQMALNGYLDMSEVNLKWWDDKPYRAAEFKRQYPALEIDHGTQCQS